MYSLTQHIAELCVVCFRLHERVQIISPMPYRPANKRLRPHLIFALTLAMYVVAPVRSGHADTAVTLDLGGSVRIALERNLGYEAARESLLLSESSLRSARGMFIPRADVTAGYTGERDERQDSSNEDTAGGVGLTENLVTGGSISAQIESHRYEARDAGVRPYGADFVTSAGISISQPLLRGGLMKVATAPLVTSERSLTIAQMSLDLDAQQLIVNVYAGYYGLVKAELINGVREIELEIAERALRDAQIRKDLGDIAGKELFEAQLRVSQAKDNLTRQMAELEDMHDSFRVLLHLEQDTEIMLDEDTEISTDEIDQIAAGGGAVSLMEDFTARKIDPEVALATALEERLELKQANLRLQNSELDEVVARNAKGPSLDVTANFNIYDTGEEYPHSLGLRDPRTLWGVQFSYPIGNISERESYQRARISRRVSEINVARLAENITQEVRSRVRQVQRTERSLHLVVEGLEFAARTYNGNKILYDAGELVFRNFSDSQKDLISQLINFFSARMDYEIELVRLDKATGRLDVSQWLE